jgi:hypothetical protein
MRAPGRHQHAGGGYLAHWVARPVSRCDRGSGAAVAFENAYRTRAGSRNIGGQPTKAAGATVRYPPVERRRR